LFREASPEERKRYYEEEWKEKDIPDFISTTLSRREFGFDYDGSGPSDRYNQFHSVIELKRILKEKYPYAVFSSVAFYDNPKKRSGWMGAELVFDIDAKDLPIKKCSCKSGEVCEICLEEAKEVVLLISDALKDHFGFKKVRYIYSGRGYHIRILDEEIMLLGRSERGKILDYISCSILPKRFDIDFGYPKLFRDRLLFLLKYAKEDNFKIKGIGKVKIRRIMKEKRKIANEIEDGEFSTLRKILGGKKFENFLQFTTRINAETVDAKVTVDVKRILRLPSSLHSKVSMKCIEIKNLEKFDPLRDAVPKFLKEEN